MDFLEILSAAKSEYRWIGAIVVGNRISCKKYSEQRTSDSNVNAHRGNHSAYMLQVGIRQRHACIFLSISRCSVSRLRSS